MPETSVPENAPVNFDAFDDLPASSLSRLDPTDSFNLHRAINDRRSALENAEMLRRLRSL